MKNKTAEEVYVEMLKPAETVTFKVQHRPDDFSMLKDVPGDGFYIRYVHIYALGVDVLQLCKRTTLIFLRAASSLSVLLYIDPPLERPLDKLKSFSSNQLCPRSTV